MHRCQIRILSTTSSDLEALDAQPRESRGPASHWFEPPHPKGSRRFAHFCAEALGPVDHSRAVHLWYCQPEQQEAVLARDSSLPLRTPSSANPHVAFTPQASSHRPVRVLFVGATFERAFGEKKEHPRARAIRALRRTAGEDTDEPVKHHALERDRRGGPPPEEEVD